MHLGVRATHDIELLGNSDRWKPGPDLEFAQAIRPKPVLALD
jgi:hypothetical protein